MLQRPLSPCVSRVRPRLRQQHPLQDLPQSLRVRQSGLYQSLCQPDSAGAAKL